jgi:hypothetical protein
MAPAQPKSTSEYLRRVCRPGALEEGLKIIAKAQDEAAAKKPPPRLKPRLKTKTWACRPQKSALKPD